MTPISRACNQSQASQRIPNLLWGAWSELGVSGWGQTHENWAIDPEALIVFTADIGDRDPRLRDEALDWCIRNWRYVSVSRLRNLVLGHKGTEFVDSWGKFAATVNSRAGVNWPGATIEHERYKITGKSTLRSFREPSLIFLRMRSIFGLSARTEILRYFVSNPEERMTAAMLATLVSYQKRNVAEACDSLVLAGVLTERVVRNRFYFSLADLDSIEEFVGAVPDISPDWNSLFHLVETIGHVADLEEKSSVDVLSVEIHDALDEIERDLEMLEMRGPRRIRGIGMIESWNQWSDRVTRDFGEGNWPEEESLPNVTSISSRRKQSRAASEAP